MNITKLDEALDAIRKISDLDENKIDSLECDLAYAEESLQQYRMVEDFDKESFAEDAFNAGVLAGKNGEELLRAWLNHKIEARL